MADTSDVQSALATLVAQVLYPAGSSGAGGWDTSQAEGWDVAGGYGSLAGLKNSVAGYPARIYRGWPVAQQLDPDLLAGTSHVTIFQANGMGRLAGGNLDPDQSYPGPPPTVTLTVSGSTVTIGGTVTPGNLVGLKVNGQAYVYMVQTGDTLASIAQALATMISGGYLNDDQSQLVTDDSGNPIVINNLALAVGPVLTINTTQTIIARTGSTGISQMRPRQQTEQFMITCWAPSPAARDAICAYLDAHLSDIRWLVLYDQQARIVWAGTITNDLPSKADCWRRDLNFRITYYTSLQMTAASMMFGELGVTADLGPTVTSIS